MNWSVVRVGVIKRDLRMKIGEDQSRRGCRGISSRKSEYREKRSARNEDRRRPRGRDLDTRADETHLMTERTE
jgi:hypothetical protein